MHQETVGWRRLLGTNLSPSLATSVSPSTLLFPAYPSHPFLSSVQLSCKQILLFWGSSS